MLALQGMKVEVLANSGSGVALTIGIDDPWVVVSAGKPEKLFQELTITGTFDFVTTSTTVTLQTTGSGTVEFEDPATGLLSSSISIELDAWVFSEVIVKVWGRTPSSSKDDTIAEVTDDRECSAEVPFTVLQGCEIEFSGEAHIAVNTTEWGRRAMATPHEIIGINPLPDPNDPNAPPVPQTLSDPSDVAALEGNNYSGMMSLTKGDVLPNHIRGLTCDWANAISTIKSKSPSIDLLLELSLTGFAIHTVAASIGGSYGNSGAGNELIYPPVFGLGVDYSSKVVDLKVESLEDYTTTSPAELMSFPEAWAISDEQRDGIREASNNGNKLAQYLRHDPPYQYPSTNPRMGDLTPDLTPLAPQVGVIRQSNDWENDKFTVQSGWSENSLVAKLLYAAQQVASFGASTQVPRNKISFRLQGWNDWTLIAKVVNGKVETT